MSIGSKIVEAIIAGNLCTVEGGGVIVWSANAHEQIDRVVADAAKPAPQPASVPAQGEPEAEPEAWSDSPEPGLHWITSPDKPEPDIVNVWVGNERFLRFCYHAESDWHDVEEYVAAGARFMRVATPLPPQGEPEASKPDGGTSPVTGDAGGGAT